MESPKETADKIAFELAPGKGWSSISKHKRVIVDRATLSRLIEEAVMEHVEDARDDD